VASAPGKLRWPDQIALNAHWFGLSLVTGTVTPLLLPYLVALLAPPDRKNTYLATARVIGLAVAMMAQPLAGLLSDRSTLPWGQRRPYILGGALCNVAFLVGIGLTPLLAGSRPAPGLSAAYAALLIGVALWQGASNVGQGALQGLIPDLVPDDQRGRASGVKAVMELLPALPLIVMGWLLDAGQIGLIIGLIGGTLLLTTLVTVLAVHEQPLAERPPGRIGGRLGRIVALALLFVAVSQAAVWLVKAAGVFLARQQASLGWQIALVGLAGLAGMAGSILVGVYLGAQIGLGREARGRSGFTWWIVNRLLFFAAIGSIQGFALYYLQDTLHIADAGTLMSALLAAVALFLIASALLGGHLADRLGRKRLVSLAGLIAAGGTFFLLLAREPALIIAGGCVLGTATGLFATANWALGTDLAPPGEAGRYLGIANLAGAGAGIVGAGIGGPLADAFNLLQPGLGYLLIFAIYGVLFLLSSAVLVRVPEAAA
jgi:MFS family permease